MSTALDLALSYQAAGLSVMPLRDGTGDELKRPAIHEWAPYQEVAADEDLIRLWWRENPNYGVGIITGTVSRLVGFDFDGPRAAALMEAKGYPLTPTATVQTGKGMHLYYRTSEKFNNRVKLFNDGCGSAVDVRGEGGYLVAPPTRHASGKVYQWIRPLSELALLPPLLEQLLWAGAEVEETAEVRDLWRAEIEQGVEEGKRNDAAARIAGYWLRVTSGHREATLKATLLWNRLNRPPLPEVEIRNTVASVYKRHSLAEKAEAAKLLPKQRVYSAVELLRSYEASGPRRGEDVRMPGLEAIDGLVPGDFITLAGRPGMGKSSYATQLCVHAAVQRYIPTWVVSLEMTKEQWVRWMLARMHDCPWKQLPRPLPQTVKDAWCAAPITLTDAGRMSIEELRQLAVGHQGVRLIIIDHIGKVDGTRKDNRTLEVGEIARGLKSLAKDLSCTVIALCQLNREIEVRDNRKPRLSDLRESGEIEQESDAVFFFHADKEFMDTDLKRRVTMSLKKNRFGPLKRFDLLFDAEGPKFTEV